MGFDEGKVYGDSQVLDDAVVMDTAEVYQNAKIYNKERDILLLAKKILNKENKNR